MTLIRNNQYLQPLWQKAWDSTFKSQHRFSQHASHVPLARLIISFLSVAASSSTFPRTVSDDSSFPEGCHASNFPSSFVATFDGPFAQIESALQISGLFTYRVV